MRGMLEYAALKVKYRKAVLIHEQFNAALLPCYINGICSTTFISDKIDFNENLTYFISNPKIGLLNKLNIFIIWHKNIFGGKHTIKNYKNIGETRILIGSSIFESIADDGGSTTTTTTTTTVKKIWYH